MRLYSNVSNAIQRYFEIQQFKLMITNDFNDGSYEIQDILYFIINGLYF